jgi:outer membrane protein assembly factor BamB
VYCLAAETGTLVWKFRGAPADRPDRRQLGNGHLVSFWPVRGGAVIQDGIVYFGSGIWPTFGIFIYALDVETGKVKWTNNDLNYIANVSADHDLHIEAALSPQGMFAASGGKLLVPNGRAMPAGLDLATGRLIYYTQGCRNGDSRVAAHGNFGFVGKSGVINLQDFREVGSKWVGRGSQPPEGYSFKQFKQVDMKESTWPPYKFVVACDASSAFKNGLAYGMENGTVYAYDVTHPKMGTSEVQFYDVKVKPLSWEPPLIWSFKTPFTGTSCPVIVAGNRIYASARNRIIAVDGAEGRQQIAWDKEVKGTPSSFAAADGKLFVATKEGWLHCFGEGPAGRTYDDKPLALESSTDGVKGSAELLLKATGITSGYCLVLGLNDGRLVEDILNQTALKVLAVDDDASRIEALRIRFERAGLLGGGRVELFTGSPWGFQFPPYIASLIVSEKPVSSAKLKTGIGRLFSTLHPYGGTLCLQMADKDAVEFGRVVTSANLAKAVVQRQGDLSLLRREGPLPGSSAWTHQKADAAGTACSQDELVRAPLGCLWYGDIPDSFNAYKRAGSGGRVYALQQHNRAGVLSAYDAYTGRFLWKNRVEGGLVHFAAMPDAVYAAGNGKCFAYEPETGKQLNVFTFGNPTNSHVREIRVGGDVIVLMCSDTVSTWHTALQDGMRAQTLIGLDRSTGTELWRRRTTASYNIDALAVDAGMVFCVDHPAFDDAWIAAQKAGKSTRTESTTLALDARTGKVIWSKGNAYILPDRHSKGSCGIRDDWLAYAPEKGIIVSGRFKSASGYEAKSGKVLWENKEIYPTAYNPVILYFRPTPLVVRRGQLAFSDGSTFDMTSGNPVTPIFRREAHGCNSAVASVHLLMIRDSTVSYTDIEEGKIYHTRNVRSGCVNNLIAADGLLSVPEASASCICNYPIQTSFAMMYMPETAAWSGTTPLQMTPPPALPGKDSRGSGTEGTPQPRK